jgi:hypothetical protein
MSARATFRLIAVISAKLVTSRHQHVYIYKPQCRAHDDCPVIVSSSRTAIYCKLITIKHWSFLQWYDGIYGMMSNMIHISCLVANSHRALALLKVLDFIPY